MVAFFYFNFYTFLKSYTFENIQSNTTEIWKVQRYRLIIEYLEAPLFPCPFNLIETLFKYIRNLIFKQEDEITIENGLEKSKFFFLYL